MVQMIEIYINHITIKELRPYYIQTLRQNDITKKKGI